MKTNNMTQIEPIEVYGCENNAVFLKVYHSINNGYIWRVEMLDDVDGVLFTSVVTAKTIEDVAQQLGLTINNK